MLNFQWPQTHLASFIPGIGFIEHFLFVIAPDVSALAWNGGFTSPRGRDGEVVYSSAEKNLLPVSQTCYTATGL